MFLFYKETVRQTTGNKINKIFNLVYLHLKRKKNDTTEGTAWVFTDDTDAPTERCQVFTSRAHSKTPEY